MKKKNGKRIIAGLLAAGLFAASVLSPLQPEGAAAATKIKVSKTKVTGCRRRAGYCQSEEYRQPESESKSVRQKDHCRKGDEKENPHYRKEERQD